MRMEIGRLHRRLKNTVIYVTHDQVEAMTLADRIVVLEGGHVRQVGAPMELYEAPANRFVAGFIGTLKMGFLNARVVNKEGDKTGLAINNSPSRTISLNISTSRTDTSDDVMLGVRPEHCWLAESEGALISGEVLGLERLGADTFVFMDIDGADEPFAVRLRNPDQHIASGDILGVMFDTSKIHVFDSDGESISVERKSVSSQVG